MSALTLALSPRQAELMSPPLLPAEFSLPTSLFILVQQYSPARGTLAPDSSPREAARTAPGLHQLPFHTDQCKSLPSLSRAALSESLSFSQAHSRSRILTHPPLPISAHIHATPFHPIPSSASLQCIFEAHMQNQHDSLIFTHFSKPRFFYF
jgi:hypothetical protein